MNSCTPFVRKTYQLVTDTNTNKIVSWSGNGKTFRIWQSQKFQSEILPQYFKHNNLCSFVRQLNTYGFRKISAPESDSNELEFYHPCFINGSKHLLSQITRKKSSKKSTQSSVPSSPVDYESENFSDTKLAEAIITLVKRQRESEQKLLSVCKELEQARMEIDTLSRSSNSSVCGKRKFFEVEHQIEEPATKRMKVKKENDQVLNFLEETEMFGSEMITFDDLFSKSQNCSSEVQKDYSNSNNFNFDVQSLLLDL